jgi:hypothetical protein
MFYGLDTLSMVPRKNPANRIFVINPHLLNDHTYLNDMFTKRESSFDLLSLASKLYELGRDSRLVFIPKTHYLY